MGDNKPIIAMILSFLIPGLGHGLINKKWKKGFILFIVAFIVVGLLPNVFLGLYAIFSAIDAYREDKGQPIWKFD